MPFWQIIERLTAFGEELVDEDEGVCSHVYACEIESPLELDVVRDEMGELRIGSTPPIYYVDTSFRPSFHRLRFSAERSQDSNGQ